MANYTVSISIILILILNNGFDYSKTGVRRDKRLSRVVAKEGSIPKVTHRRSRPASDS